MGQNSTRCAMGERSWSSESTNGNCLSTCSKGNLDSNEDAVVERKQLATFEKDMDATAANDFHPVVYISDNFHECIHLLRADQIFGLPLPWPRCQDIEREGTMQNSYKPAPCDLVFALSHAWPYQTHPDPAGKKHYELVELVRRSLDANFCSGVVYGFVDFLSIVQRPWEDGQAPRTPEQDLEFQKAVSMLPLIYLDADILIHIDTPWYQAEGCGIEYEVCSNELVGILGNFRDRVEVTRKSMNGLAAHHDYIIAVEGKQLTSSPNAEELSDRFAEAQKADLPVTVRLVRAPFGMWNKIPASRRGWVFLERFYTMVQLALLDDSSFDKICFSNSQDILDQIREGAGRLRSAAAGGQRALAIELKNFVNELCSLQFQAASTDWALRVQQESDHQMVSNLMQIGVNNLLVKWEKAQQVQFRRQVVVALYRKDGIAVEEYLQRGVDPNYRCENNSSLLHIAARCHSLPMVRLLLKFGGDISKRDKFGNLPAHVIALFRDDATVELMKELAPSEVLLTSNNSNAMSPLDRFMMYANTELSRQPMPSADAYLQALRTSYPALLAKYEDDMDSNVSSEDDLDCFHSQEEVAVGGRIVHFDVYSPIREDIAEHILCFITCFFVPWKIAQIGLKTVFVHMVKVRRARMVVLSQKSIGVDLEQVSSFRELHIRVGEIIGALPLPEQYFILDSSLGALTPVLWTLLKKLRGALIINLRGLFSDLFSTSEMKTKMSNRFACIANYFGDKDISKLSELLGDYVWTKGVRQAQRSEDRYKECTRCEDQNFFSYGELYCRLISTDIMETTQMYKAAPKWLEGVPVVLASGAFSPATWTQEAVVHLQTLLNVDGECTLASISNSKSCWELEGKQQAAEVARLLAQLTDNTNSKFV